MIATTLSMKGAFDIPLDSRCAAKSAVRFTGLTCHILAALTGSSHSCSSASAELASFQLSQLIISEVI